MKIGLFTDVHYCTKEVLCNTRRPSLSLKKLLVALDYFKTEKVEFLICLGDLVDTDDSDEQNEINLAKVADLINGSGLECYCCMGNHDANLFNKSKFQLITKFKTAPLALSKSGNLLFFLDANYTENGKAYQKNKVEWKETYIPKKQIDGLRNTLDECEEQNVIIFSHQSLDAFVDVDHQIKNSQQIRQIIKNSSKVTAVYQGHYHSGAHNNNDNVTYITLKAMCEGTENSFLVIDI